LLHQPPIEDTYPHARQVANKKQRDTAAADAEMKAKREQSKVEQGGNDGEGAPTDLLAADDDDDVIF
jgi:V-type H+-transporting ATPase subunit D